MKKEFLMKNYMFCCFLFLLACTNVNEKMDKNKAEGVSNNILPDTLISWSKKELKMQDLSIIDDTLKFVTPAKQIYYPLGKFKNIEDLMLHFPMLKLDKEGSSSSEGVFRFIFDNSYIKFYKDEETGNLEIIYAAIIDSKIKFTNNIEVGVSSKQFYDVFFNKTVNLDRIRVVKVESALSGMIHYYYMRDGKLGQIEMDSDYLIDKG